MTCSVHEGRVVGVRHLKSSHFERIDPDAMDWPFIRPAVVRSHEEGLRGDENEAHRDPQPAPLQSRATKTSAAIVHDGTPALVVVFRQTAR